jgi:GNAT superfamily N-acetyltransferase
MPYSLLRLTELNNSQIIPIQRAAQAEAYSFIERLIAEYASGANCFNQPGEVLFGVFNEQNLIGIGGLNCDPYSPNRPNCPNHNIGRVRHIYVLPEYRRLGVARQLVTAIIAAAHGAFTALTLSTAHPSAAHLYEQLGFIPVTGEPKTTHILGLDRMVNNIVTWVPCGSPHRAE